MDKLLARWATDESAVPMFSMSKRAYRECWHRIFTHQDGVVHQCLVRERDGVVPFFHGRAMAIIGFALRRFPKQRSSQEPPRPKVNGSNDIKRDADTARHGIDEGSQRLTRAPATLPQVTYLR